MSHEDGSPPGDGRGMRPQPSSVSHHQSRKRQEGPLIEPQGDIAPWHFVLGLLAPRTTRKEKTNSCCFMPKTKFISKLQEFQSKISSAFILCRVRKNSFLLLIYNIFKSQSIQGTWNFSWCYSRRIVWKPLGQKISTRLEGKVIVLCSQHFSSDFTYEQ